MAALGEVTTIDVTIERGSDLYIPLQVQQSYCDAMVEADIAGTTWLATIRDTDSLASAVNQTITPTITDAANRKLQVFITDTVNEAVPLGANLWDVWRTNADKEHCFVKGDYTTTSSRRVP